MIYIQSIHPSSLNNYNKELKQLESIMEYPYGKDFFKIDHGKSYFSFFKRLGLPYFNIALYNEKVIACGCGIIRQIPYKNKMKKSWYICDLKVHPEFRGQGIPARLFKKKLIYHFLKCPRGYTISMDPLQGPNKVVKMIEKFPLFPLKKISSLHFFEFSKNEVMTLKSDIENIINDTVSFKSLSGIKDIVLKSSNTPLPLLHAQYGSMADSSTSLQMPSEGRYMFCAVDHSDLHHFFLHRNFQPSAKASILAYNMKFFDWNFILSSDI